MQYTPGIVVYLCSWGNQVSSTGIAVPMEHTLHPADGGGRQSQSHPQSKKMFLFTSELCCLYTSTRKLLGLCSQVLNLSSEFFSEQKLTLYNGLSMDQGVHVMHKTAYS